MLPGDRAPLGALAPNLHRLAPTTVPDWWLQLLSASGHALLQPPDAREQPRLEDEMVLRQGQVLRW
jgi:hypothetical protein